MRTTHHVGFAGLGRMGHPMARQLAGTGPLTVYNRTHSVAEAFASATGATAAASPRELADDCSVVVTMVADGQALLGLIDGDDGLTAGLTPGDVVVDMGTSGSDATRQARDLLRAVGAHLVEAPVSGSVAAAESRQLLVMAAGDEAPLEIALPVLQGISDRVVTVGGPGAGAAMKLAVNSVLFAINQAIAESLVLAERSGIERSVAYDVFASSAVAAPVVHYRRAVFEQPESAPVTFTIDLAIKDLDLVLALGAEVGAPLPQVAANREAMRAAAAAGMGPADMGAVAVHLRQAAGEPAGDEGGSPSPT
jgi:3-hydroxyisobutyrate dehydrogenase/2-hydroxy-3-oxopropionate reductase